MANPSVVTSSPNHAASTSVRSKPLSTEATASLTAIGTMSLTPRPNSSPNGVIPAPTIATLLMRPPPRDRLALSGRKP